MEASIKPIETIYKGFRFRSRLEARWAVVFDALGVEWEYEKEGYDVEGTWYLPDFWLPKQNTFIEIKPLPANNIYSIYPQKKIYLGGKISKDDWRSELLTDDKIFGWFGYSGPTYQEKMMIEHDRDNSEEIYDSCIDGINDCDIFFAWLNAVDHHATLSEIGYAKGIGKRLWLGVNNSFNELLGDDYWFIYKMADNYVVEDDAGAALMRLLFYEYLNDHHNLYRSLAFHKNIENGYIIYGSPGYNYAIYSAKHWWHGLLTCKDYIIGMHCYWSSPEVVSALNKAKQARFEHGEKG